MKKTMYTLQGEAVKVFEKTHNGYLGKHVYDDFDDEDYLQFFEEEQPLEYFEILFDKVPVKTLQTEVKQLESEKANLLSQIAESKKVLKTLNSEISTITKYPIVGQLLKYLNGNFEYAVFLHDLSIKEKSKFYNTRYVRTAAIKNSGFGIYLMHQEYYTSGDDKKIMTFDTKEEALLFAENELLQRIKKFDAAKRYSLSHLNNMLKNISNKELMKSEKFILLLEEKRLECKKAETERQQEEIRKKEEELNKLKNKL